MPSDLDDDDFLYGSDDEAAEPPSKRVKVANLNVGGKGDAGVRLPLATNPNNIKPESSTEDKGNSDSTSQERSNKRESDSDEEEEEDSDSNDDDDDDDDSEDDDIEFIIGETGPQKTTSSATSDTKPETSTDTKDGTTTIVLKDSEAKVGLLDIDKVAELDGKPLTQVDLEKLKNKPWRIPGADITDYFNYGFDEFSWTAYCHKQDKLRGEFNPQKLMAQLLNSAPMPPVPGNAGGNKNGNNGMKMPGMPMNMVPGMPPMMPGMPGMPGMPMMPGMPNLPPFNPNKQFHKK